MRCVLVGLPALMILGGAARAQVFTGLGFAPGASSSNARGVSADGTTVVGDSGSVAFRWTRDGGYEVLGTLPGGPGTTSYASATSHYGLSVVGSSFDGARRTAFLWTVQNGMQSLGTLGGDSYCTGISANGGLIVGNSQVPPSLNERAFRMVPGGAMTLLDPNAKNATDVSSDGSSIVGYLANDHMFRWRAAGGLVDLGAPGMPPNVADANGCSSDGTFIVGLWNDAQGFPHLFRWRDAYWGDIPGWPGSPHRVSGDGSVIVGWASPARSPQSARMWVGDQLFDLNTYLPAHGVNLTGWNLTQAVGVSTDGQTIVGNGVHNGAQEAWAWGAVLGPPVVFLNGTGVNSSTDNSGNGNANGRIDPGESDVRVSVQVHNSGNTTGTGITGTLTTSTPTVSLINAASAYPDLPGGGGAAVNSTPFVLSVSPDHVCGDPIALTLHIASAQMTHTYNFSLGTGRPLIESYTGPALAIPDNDPAGATATLAVSGYPGNITHLSLRFDGAECSNAQGAPGVGLDHSWVGDLVVTLISPQGTSVTLMNHPGSANNFGRNFCQTVLDDSATGLIQNISLYGAPYTGSFRPASPLSAFSGQSPNGVWQLHAVDSALGNGGHIRSFSLIFGIGGTNTICVPARLACGSADFDCDGNVGTDADIESFFACLAGNCPAAPCASTADFNGDGDVGTDADIEAFFRVLGGGHC